MTMASKEGQLKWKQIQKFPFSGIHMYPRLWKELNIMLGFCKNQKKTGYERPYINYDLGGGGGFDKLALEKCWKKWPSLRAYPKNKQPLTTIP